MTWTDTATLVEADTEAGRVRGRWRGEPGGPGASAAFLGIPFAEPPVGELRFAAPVPHRPWAGVRDALEFGPTAQRGDPGVTLIPEPSVPGESTLNVNVFTPSPGVGAALPVLVWIHGGGFFAGSPASPWYDGRAFNRDGVVTVSISYRLGFDGFGWIADAPSNRGVRDWLLALEWVQRNIAGFGGDPGRVTIAGQSAGGGAVLTLLGMPAAQRLFHGVFCISGATADVAAERAERIGRRVAELGGVEPTRAGLGELDEARIHELQQQATAPADPAAGVVALLEDGLSLGPAIDGELITRPTAESIAAGVGADNPLVLGATDDEFSMAVAPAEKKLRWVPKSIVLRKSGLPGAEVRPYLAANRDVARRGTAAVLGRYVTDRMFRAPALRVAGLRGAAPTWLYRFAWRSGAFGSAVHCLDVPFFFDCLDSPVGIAHLAGANPPQALADEVHGAAVAFATGGDPGWARYTAEMHLARVYDTPSSVRGDAYAGVEPLLIR